MDMTFETAFKNLKKKFVNVDASVLEDMAIQITISDEDCGGTFYAEVKNNVLAVEPYDYKDNDAIVDATRAALNALLDGKATADALIEKGDMTVMGNLEKVAAVNAAIKLPAKKAPAKKTAEKKAPAKKTAEKKPAEKKPAEKKTEAKAVDVKETVKKPVEKKTVKTTVKKTTVTPAAAEPAKKAPAKKEETVKKTK